MAKIIKITPEYVEGCRREFEIALSTAKLADGKINFSKTFSYGEKRRATLYFTSEAWTKMVLLIQEFDKEVAWHGLAKRGESEALDEYIVYDITVYPQEVTGGTVNTDQKAYESWLMEKDDDAFNNIRMQGHSHVNMHPSPSGVDLNHQERILDQLEDDMFYIFMVWNKSFKKNIKIYDLSKNTLFEDSDVDCKIYGSSFDMNAFLSDAKSMVKEKVFASYPSTPSYQGQQTIYHEGKPYSIGPYNPVASFKDQYTSPQPYIQEPVVKNNPPVKESKKKKEKIKTPLEHKSALDDDEEEYGMFGKYSR